MINCFAVLAGRRWSQWAAAGRRGLQRDAGLKQQHLQQHSIHLSTLVYLKKRNYAAACGGLGQCATVRGGHQRLAAAQFGPLQSKPMHFSSVSFCNCCDCNNAIMSSRVRPWRPAAARCGPHRPAAIELCRCPMKFVEQLLRL